MTGHHNLAILVADHDVFGSAAIGNKDALTAFHTLRDALEAGTLRSAQPGDIVLLAGKGHEKIQILASGTIPFDDAAVAADIVQKL